MTVSKQLAEILNKLQKVKNTSTGGFSAACPAHEDKHNSLSITEEDNKILVKCYTGCTTEQIVSALGIDMKDLFTDTSEHLKETRWPIRNKAGELIAEHVRYDKDGKKTFAWYRDGKKGLGDIKTADLPLYGIDKVNGNDCVIICEGEKAADALIARGYQAVGTVSGASSCPSLDSLMDLVDIENIYLWPDNDEPGRKHMDNLAGKLIELGKKPSLITWAEAPSKGDAADYMGDIDILLSAAVLWGAESKGPQMEQGFGFVKFAWPDLGIKVLVDRYTDKGHAELGFYSVNGDNKEKLIHYTQANMLSTTTMSSLAKRLEKHTTEVNWSELLTLITGKVLELARTADEVSEIWPDDKSTLEVEYLLYPVLYLNHPSVLFGDYGSLKSWMSLVIAYIVQLPYYDNGLGFQVSEKSSTCLFLDYEDDNTSFQKRWSAMSKGFSHTTMPLLHQRMTAPLYENVDQIKRLVDEKRVRLIIIDSLGPAARGNLNDPEPAIKYHAALRQIGVTSLTLAHTSKDSLSKKRTIFGSVFFTNLARSVWECRAEQEVGEDEVIISLKHNKANLSRLHNPLGFKFKFGHNSVSVNKADLENTGLSGDLPIPRRIEALLANEGDLSNKEIAEKINEDYASVKAITYKMGKKGILVKVGGNWGLAYEEG